MRRSARSVWNSLEVVKLTVTVFTAVLALVAGYVVWNAQRDVVQRWEGQQTIEKQNFAAKERERDRIRDFRLSIYKDAAPLLNDIHSYHFLVGRWKELTPAQIVEKKRQLDSLMYSHEALFSEIFFSHYHAFMKAAFRGAGNHMDESRIRSQFRCRAVHLGQESEKWRRWFTNEDNRRGICLAYRRLLGRLSEELLFHNLGAPEASEEQTLTKCPPLYDIPRCDEG
jgi:hypothetical protein